MEPDIWRMPAGDALAALETTRSGLTRGEAALRAAAHRGERLAAGPRTDALALLLRQFRSPLVLLLVGATILSGLLGELVDALLILAIVLMSGGLGFWQEHSAHRAVEALLASVRVLVEVRRDGQVVSVPIADVVPGDIVELNTGDIVPGDCRLLESRTMLIDASALTGESLPVEKSADATPPADAALVERSDAVLLGTHVAGGDGVAIVVAIGTATAFGHIAGSLRARSPVTAFERGLTDFGKLLLRAMAVLVGAIFLVNVVLQRPLIDSALFSLALAVGLTPQLLPAIVTVSLAQGARAMAARRVIVKRLDAIEDFGSMTILCTDKTGTLTTGTMRLEDSLDVSGQPSDEVARLALLNASFQQGFPNPIDAAIVAAVPARPDGTRRLDELPYDFERRRLSVLVMGPSGIELITKGAVDDVLAVCDTAHLAPDHVVPIAEVRERVLGAYAGLSERGLRILAIARRTMPDSTRLEPADESQLTLVGFLTFLDPPKPGARETLADLAASGVSVRMVTGDNRLIAAHVGEMAGLPTEHVLTGAQVHDLDDAALRARAADVSIFAEVEPTDKERIVRALVAGPPEGPRPVVGYLGDGINDAPALHAADIGISVDSAADVAKEAAAVVLLDKDLRVLLDAVRQGRSTFANTMKYVFTTATADLGNTISMAAATLFLPFLPLLTIQILLLNFLSDVPTATIATDANDPEQLDHPRGWDVPYLGRFMLAFGLISTAFDLLTFAVLRLGFNADSTEFRSAWFLESVCTELAVLFVLRTRRPFFRSRPGRLLVAASVVLAVVTLALPLSPLAPLLGLAPVPWAIVGALLLITMGYVLATELAKRWFFRSDDRQRVPLGPAAAAHQASPDQHAAMPTDRDRPVARP